MSDAALRWLLGATGALAGFAFFVLIDEAALAGTPASLHRFVVFFALAFFPAFGLMAGPLAPGNAAKQSAFLAVATAGLVTLTGARFSVTRPQDILEPTGKGLFVLPFIALAAALIPFAIAANTNGGWRAYTLLFKTAWQAGIKALIALLFVGLFWAVYFLSDALLQLVGLDVLEDLVDIDPVPYMLTGTILGLALAVAFELDSVIETLLSLVLRLFSLLLVPVTAVIALFVLAALFQGLDEVFDRRSAAAMMLAMAAGATLLVIATLGTTEERPLHAATLWSLRALGVVLPIMAAIALYALWLRIAQYGWTPERVLAAITAVIACLFILPVTIFAIRATPGWQNRTRQGFVYSAIGGILLGALWFTPVLNAQRISASSQLARLLDGRADAASYDFWPIAREWGHAGTSAMAAFKASAPDETVLTMITTVETANTRYQATRETKSPIGRKNWETFLSSLETRPKSGTLPSADELTEAAAKLPPPGFNDALCLAPDRPRCIAIAGEFVTSNQSPEWLITYQVSSGAYPRMVILYQQSDTFWTFANTGLNAEYWSQTDLIETLRNDPLEFASPKIQGLKLGKYLLLPRLEED